MVNSGSFESDVDRNEKGKFTQPRRVAESPHSMSSGPVVSGSLCENDFTTQTADSLPVSQAIEPTATKTEYKCNMSDLLIRSSEILPPQCVSDNIIANRENNATYNGQVTLISEEECSAKLEKSLNKSNREIVKKDDIINDDLVEKCNLHNKLVNKDEEIKAKVSVCCSVPLEKVQNVLMTYRSTISDSSSTTSIENKKQILKKDMCLYCDRTFLTSSLKQKHVERYHSLKYNRRLSARRQVAKHSLTACIYCDKLNDSECNLRQLFEHLVTEHPKKYFGCLDCEMRFPNVQIFKNHIISFHENKKESLLKQHSIDIVLSDDKRDVLDNKIVKSCNPALKRFPIEDEDKDETNRSSLSKNSDSSVKTSEPKTVKVKNGVKLKQEDKKIEDEKGKSLPAATNALGSLPIKPNSNTSHLSNENRLSHKEKSKVNWVKDLRNKKVSVIGTKIGVKQCLRMTRQQSRKQVEDIKNNKKAKAVKNDNGNKNAASTKYLSFQNRSYSAYDVAFRIKKITDHSIDNLKISSLTFDDVFDKTFFNRVKCNIQENLLNHVDGKLFKSIESENRISSFQKSKDLPSDETNQNETCTSGTLTSGCLLSDTQLGEDAEVIVDNNTKTTKKKATSNDEVHYKYFTRRKYQAVLSENKQHRDLSKLDMWTQLAVKNRQQKIICDQKSDKEIIEYKKSDEYKVKMQIEELNTILDKRGPLEDLKEEAIRTVTLEKLNGTVVDTNMESYFDVAVILNELLDNLFTPTTTSPTNVLRNESAAESNNTSSNNCHGKFETSEMNEEIPNILNLRRVIPENSATKLPESVGDTSAELTGEWARTRIYVCAACGTKVPNAKSLVDHKNLFHEHVWCQHYEFVGNQGELYRHLSIPGLGKIGEIETSGNRMWRRSEARVCSKCNKQFNCLGDLHRHVLECGGDWSWMLVRKKYKYRPYGSKARKKRRGLLKYLQSFRERKLDKPREGKPIKKFDGPRQKPSDADTIQRMLANLPAKRITRKLICLKDGFQRAVKNRNVARTNQNNTLNQKKKQIQTITKDSRKNRNLLKNSNALRRSLRSNSNIVFDNKIKNVIMPKFKKNLKDNKLKNLNIRRNVGRQISKVLPKKIKKTNNNSSSNTSSLEDKLPDSPEKVTADVESGNKTENEGIVLNGSRSTRRKSLENKSLNELHSETLKTKKKLKTGIVTKKTDSDISLVNENKNKKVSKIEKDTKGSLEENEVSLKSPKKKQTKNLNSQGTENVTKVESPVTNVTPNESIKEVSDPLLNAKITKKKKRKANITCANNVNSEVSTKTSEKVEITPNKDRKILKRSKIQNVHKNINTNAHPPGRRKNKIITKVRNLKSVLRKRKPVSLRNQITNIVQVDGSSQSKPSTRSKNSKNEFFHIRIQPGSNNLKNFHHSPEENVSEPFQVDKLIVSPIIESEKSDDKCEIISTELGNSDNTANMVNIINEDKTPKINTIEEVDLNGTINENNEELQNHDSQKCITDNKNNSLAIDSINKAKRNRKPRGLNDCIAMLTNKLQIKGTSHVDSVETDIVGTNQYQSSDSSVEQSYELQNNLLPDTNSTANINLENTNLEKDVDTKKDINIESDIDELDNSSNISNTSTTPNTSSLWGQLDKNLGNKIIIKSTANETSLKFSIITKKTASPCLESRITNTEDLECSDYPDGSLETSTDRETSKTEDETKDNEIVEHPDSDGFTIEDYIPIKDIFCKSKSDVEEDNVRSDILIEKLDNIVESPIENLISFKKPKVKKHKKKKADENHKGNQRSSKSIYKISKNNEMTIDGVNKNVNEQLNNITLDIETPALDAVKEELVNLSKQIATLEEMPKHSKHKKQNKLNTAAKKKREKKVPKLVINSKYIENTVIANSENVKPVTTGENNLVDSDDDVPLAEIVKKSKSDSLDATDLSASEETQTVTSNLETPLILDEEGLINEESNSKKEDSIVCNEEKSNTSRSSSISENIKNNIVENKNNVKKVRCGKLKLATVKLKIPAKRGRKPQQNKISNILGLKLDKPNMDTIDAVIETVATLQTSLNEFVGETNERPEMQSSEIDNLALVNSICDTNHGTHPLPVNKFPLIKSKGAKRGRKSKLEKMAKALNLKLDMPNIDKEESFTDKPVTIEANLSVLAGESKVELKTLETENMIHVKSTSNADSLLVNKLSPNKPKGAKRGRKSKQEKMAKLLNLKLGMADTDKNGSTDKLVTIEENLHTLLREANKVKASESKTTIHEKNTSDCNNVVNTLPANKPKGAKRGRKSKQEKLANILKLKLDTSNINKQDNLTEKLTTAETILDKATAFLEIQAASEINNINHLKDNKSVESSIINKPKGAKRGRKSKQSKILNILNSRLEASNMVEEDNLTEKVAIPEANLCAPVEEIKADSALEIQILETNKINQSISVNYPNNDVYLDINTESLEENFIDQENSIKDDLQTVFQDDTLLEKETNEIISVDENNDEENLVMQEKDQNYEESTNESSIDESISTVEEENSKENIKEPINNVKPRHKRKLKNVKSKNEKISEKNSSLKCHNIQSVYCDICNKTFTRTENLLKHKRTLTHIAKLSEIEAREAAERLKQQDSVQEVHNLAINTGINDENSKLSTSKDNLSDVDDSENIPECDDNYPNNVELTKYPLSSPTQNSLKLVDIINDVLSKPIEDEFAAKHPNFSDLILPSDSEIKRCKSLGERKSFDSDKLSIYSNTSPSTHHLDQKYIVSKLPTAADLIVEKQISLLENMIEDNQNNMKCTDNVVVSSNHSTNEEYSSQSNSSEFSILSTSKAEDCNDITFTHNTNIITNLIKPTLDEDNLIRSTQYEAISEDSSSSHFHIEEQKSRKILNRDEELFLECCSLLKSSSDVSDFCKKATKPTQFLNGFGLKSFDELEWLEHKNLSSKKVNDFESVSNNYVSEDSHINASTGENFYSNLPYSNPEVPNYHLNLKTMLARNSNETLFSQPPIFEDISRESEDLPVKFMGNCFKTNSSNITINVQDETSDCVSPNVESAQVPEDHNEMIEEENEEEAEEVANVENQENPDVILEDDNEVCEDINKEIERMAELDLKAKTESDSEFLSPQERKSSVSKITTQAHITDFTTAKKTKKHHSTKMLTKGAMKEFEELKVSIPKDGLNMKKIINCSPASKRLEIEALEESASIDKKSHSEKPAKRNSTIGNVIKCSKLGFKKIGNKLGLKVTKKKYLSNHKNSKTKNDNPLKEKKSHDIYDFEETQDNMDIFQNNSDTFPIYRSFRNKVPEDSVGSTKSVLPSDTENQDVKSHISSVYEKDDERIPTPELSSSKKISVGDKSITKKKCMIMGRIFKNALKSKIADDIKNIPTIENSKIVENYVMNCPPPVDIQHENCGKDHKLSEEEMNILFDNLLNDENADNTIRNNKDKHDDRKEFRPSSVLSALGTKERESEYKIKQKGNKAKRKPRGSSPASSDEEFSIKVPKRQCTKKSANNNECVINLEQELKECIGVASRKSQRKCTSGKQNVLVEYWSSDESSFDVENITAIQNIHNKTNNIVVDDEVEDTTISTVMPIMEDYISNCDKEIVDDIDKKDDKEEDKLLAEPPNTSVDNSIDNFEINNLKKRSGGNKRKKSIIKSVPKEDRINTDIASSEINTSNFSTIAATRKKRTAVDTLYYWSSSSEDELQDIIEVKSPREQYDEEDRPLQHGWIVGDSPKKLVTMLAQAKGKKLEVECVKKNKKKKTGV